MKKIIYVLIALLLLTGCGSSKKEVVDSKKIEADNGTKEVNETISKSKDTVEYTFETESVNVVASMKYNKKFKYTEGSIKNNHYTITMELVETYLPMFDQYKGLAGYESFKVDGKEAIRTNSDASSTVMIKISDIAILYVRGITDGKILTTEMTEDSAYKNVINSIKIKITEK